MKLNWLIKKKQITNSDELDRLIGQTVKLIWGEQEYKIKIIG